MGAQVSFQIHAASLSSSQVHTEVKNATSASISSVINVDNKDYSLERRISKNYVSSFYVNNEKTNFETYKRNSITELWLNTSKVTTR